ncbi:MAG TPA: outer membrane lipoprotein-sorting protein [Gammaproteobacteria bacterium]|nr:outer membrane lipoprotein-sorting protein [Gammaproteobacteria bacterium]
MTRANSQCTAGAALILALATFSASLSAQGLSADEIMARSAHVDGGRDGLFGLAFTFEPARKPKTELRYTMVWKTYPDDPKLDTKVIFYSEYPPDDHGKAFMAFIYHGKKDDHWLYLPELRMVRKISHGRHQHQHDNDEFGKTQLTRGDMVPRAPDADRHRLLGVDERLRGRYYKIESTPLARSEEYPYAKAIRWIDAETFLPWRVDYYGERGAEAVKRLHFDWDKIGSAWVWKKVVAENLVNGSKTTLDVSHVRLNIGLSDRIFSKRSLMRRPESLR